MAIEDLRFRRRAGAVVLEGTAKPGALIKVENASAAPMNAQWQADTFKQTHADAKGHFEVMVPAAIEGDKVRVQADDLHWQVVAVKAGGTDNRRAEFNPEGFRLIEQAPGVYGIETVSANVQACEPGTVVQLVNLRDHHGGQFQLDADGRFPADFQLRAEPGDVFALSCTDGVTNTDFQNPAGFLVAPPAPAPGGGPIEPGMIPGDQGAVKPVTGPLFVGPPKAADAVQGEDLGDCYLVTTLAAMAEAIPETVRRLITDNGDGTFTVAFQRYDTATRQYVADPVTVSNVLPVDEHGVPRYGRGDASAPKMALWFPILEKAYAAWKGGYTGIINGFPYEIFEATLGKTGVHHDVRSEDPVALFESIRSGLANHQPLVAWTNVDSTELPFSGTRLVPDHAYAILGISDRNGEKTVTVRNPYAHEQPATGPDDRGVTTIPWKTFLTYYVGLGTVVP